MNKAMLPKLEGMLVRLCPQPRELNRESRGEPPRDMVFRVEEASEKDLFLRDTDSGVGLRLAPDHIREYLTGGKLEPLWGTVGFLNLKVQYSFRGDDLSVEPLFGPSAANTQARYP